MGDFTMVSTLRVSRNSNGIPDHISHLLDGTAHVRIAGDLKVFDVDGTFEKECRIALLRSCTVFGLRNSQRY